MEINYPTDVIAETWLDLHEILFREKDKDLDRFRTPYVYRGLSNKNYELLTSLQRIGTTPELVERHIVRNFRKYAPHDIHLHEHHNYWSWLALGQHHGLPTRLLDWTFSPYIALHFACQDIETFNQDGAIWCVDFYKSREYLPPELCKKLDDSKFKAFSVDIMEKLYSDTDSLTNASRKNGNFLMFFEPPSFDNRIVNQFALFSIMADSKAKTNRWLEKKPNLFFRVIIKKELKWEIRDKLDQANITERVIIGGLDGLSLWIKRWYSQKK